MRGFFSLDGSFSKFGSFIADIMILSLMWLLFSLPLLTIGAATSALFYVSTRRIAEREGYITADFWRAFKENFKRATIIWLIMLAVLLLVIFNISVLGELGDIARFILPVQIVILAQLALVSVYVFPVVARFDMSVAQAVKSSFFMSIRHFFTSFSCIVIMLGVVMVVLHAPLLFFVAPGLYAMFSSYMIVRVFKKYHPDMDKDPMLEIQEIEAAKAEERRKNEQKL